MKNSKFLCLSVLAIAISISGFSQKPYDKGIGLRFSNTYYDVVAATFKFFVSDAGAFDLNAGFGLKGYAYGVGPGYNKVRPFNLGISAAYQHHFEIPVRGGGFAWFIGGGLVGYRSFSSEGDYDGFGFGIFPTGGVDYKIPKIPLAVSADYRPTFFLTAPNYYDSFYGRNIGVSARYTFGKN
ncbi:MAG: hypothetical protein JNL23_07820 [Chitinophagaceae bacterium]|nr:hypothetical protein [Chitinophagaceae bacterium]